jgi:hypothetical protein
MPFPRIQASRAKIPSARFDLSFANVFYYLNLAIYILALIKLLDS